MPLTIADEKRSAIAMKLADIKALQYLAIQNEETLLVECNDPEIRKWIGEMLDDDRKNLTILDNVIIQYGIKSEPRDTVQELVQNERQMIQGTHLSFYEKVSLHELLKHQLAMAGVAVNKAGQVVGSDIGKATAPLNTVNFENQAHQERLQGVLEILSTRELTGQDPEQGIWIRIQDSMAALTGRIGSMATHGDSSPDLKVTEIVRMDHQKFQALFNEIKGTDSPQRLTEFFAQLYRDLGAHTEAEEMTWYGSLLKYNDSVQATEQAFKEQELAKNLLEEIRQTSSSAPEFKAKVLDLQGLVNIHIDHEERELFKELENHFSDDQLVALGRDFQRAKSRLQDTKYAAVKL